MKNCTLKTEEKAVALYLMQTSKIMSQYHMINHSNITKTNTDHTAPGGTRNVQEFNTPDG
jgi:hypothetical protein